VLDESGDAHGAIEDAVFESDSGTLTELRTTAGSISASRLRGIGSYAVVLRNEDER